MLDLWDFSGNSWCNIWICFLYTPHCIYLNSASGLILQYVFFYYLIGLLFCKFLALSKISVQDSEINRLGLNCGKIRLSVAGLHYLHIFKYTYNLKLLLVCYGFRCHWYRSHRIFAVCDFLLENSSKFSFKFDSILIIIMLELVPLKWFVKEFLHINGTQQSVFDFC